ncbi:MAG: hypothetical protein WA989_16685 [Henriciella sp.]|uniref:hypothetical protein n=1 Tax=Henriciella sp. TaxID=1968823 RepID=UPI003C77BA6C
MAEPQKIIEKKLVNALFKDAAANPGAKRLLSGPGQLGLGLVKKMMGGMWVGGTAWLTKDSVIFRPNALNRAVHVSADTLEVEFPLSDIKAVSWRKGIATSIIDLETEEASLSLRCYGSKAFASAIEREVEQARRS